MTLAIADGITLAACRHTGLTLEALRSRSRVQKVARTRQACIYAIARRSEWSLPTIARYFGMADHTTAMHARDVVAQRLKSDGECAELVDVLMGAEPIMPFTLEARTKALTELKTPPPSRRIMRMEKIKAAPPKPKHREECIIGDRTFFLDEDGYTSEDVAGFRKMAKGSHLLAEALRRHHPERCAA